MGKCLKIGSLCLGLAFLFGCANQNTNLVASADEEIYTLPARTETVAEHNPTSGKLLVKKAKSAIGTPYILGGSAPGGFDCSGLVQWTYNSLGVALPRTAREQASVGKKVENIKDMREGDIVAFRHPKRGYHTGIYVGDGKFVHSPRKRSSVRINSLSDPYFRSTLLGARRVDLNGSENLLASASGELEKLVAEKSHLALSARNLEKIKSASAKGVNKASKNAKKQKNTIVAKSKKKSTIASQARKIQSLKTVTGKTKMGAKNNSAAHANLAKASKNTTSKLSAAKKTLLKATVTKGKQQANKSTAMNVKKNQHKTVSMVTKKLSSPLKKRNS